jgi:hypothetical protein
MTPGVTTQSPQNGSGAGYIGATGDFSVNGQRTESNNYSVDGVSANVGAGNGYGVTGAATGGAVASSTALGTTQSLVSVDALQEFRVLSSTYSAEYGRSPGGQFNFLPRSGTDHLHGTAFDYRSNDYSVPTQYGHRQVWVKGYVHAVVIACASEVIARHERSNQREAVVFDPLHYLALLEQKTRGLDQAALLAEWQLPECFAQLRRLLEARLKKHGSREYVQVLRLMETFALAEVTHAVEDALKLGTISFDAVRHLLLCRVERRPPRLDMDNYPHLPMAQVRTTQAADYMTLLAEVCA